MSLRDQGNRLIAARKSADGKLEEFIIKLLDTTTDPGELELLRKNNEAYETLMKRIGGADKLEALLEKAKKYDAFKEMLK